MSYVSDAPKKQVGYEQLTVDNTVGGKALASIPAGAAEALIRVSAAPPSRKPRSRRRHLPAWLRAPPP